MITVDIIVGILMGLFLLDSILLVVVILLQSGKAGGLASAFGAGGAADSAFGAKVSQPLRRVTAVMAGVFFAIAIALAIMSSVSQQKTVGAGGSSVIEPEKKEQPAEGSETEKPAAKPEEGSVPDQPATKPAEGAAPDTPAATPDEGAASEKPADSGNAEKPADEAPADTE